MPKEEENIQIYNKISSTESAENDGGCNMHVLADLAFNSVVRSSTNVYRKSEEMISSVASESVVVEEMDVTTSNNETPDIPDDTDECKYISLPNIGMCFLIS